MFYLISVILNVLHSPYVCVIFSQFLQAVTECLWVRAEVDTNIAGAGGSGTNTLREQALTVRNSAGAGLRKQSFRGIYTVALK